MVAAHRPGSRHLGRTAARPSGVVGPVECCAFWRFASIFRSVNMTHLSVELFVGTGTTFRFYSKPMGRRVNSIRLQARVAKRLFIGISWTENLLKMGVTG